jgi:hypothetical protein
MSSLPDRDPTNPRRRKGTITNPNWNGTRPLDPANPQRIPVYISDDGTDWRPLTPQEKAVYDAEQRRNAPQPAPDTGFTQSRAPTYGRNY